MWILLISVVIVSSCVGALIGRVFCPKLEIDGRIVITQEGEKILHTIEFDDYDKPVMLRNQKLVVFRVEGPVEIPS